MSASASLHHNFLQCHSVVQWNFTVKQRHQNWWSFNTCTKWDREPDSL